MDDLKTDESDRPMEDLPKSPEELQPMTELKTEEPPKKRRRVVKPNSDKKFECKHEGCGKAYSRAEHLYRHQLNRRSNPISLPGTVSHISRHSQEHLSMRLP